jgi:hypothetical protein
MNFETNQATALSLTTISGGSLANLFTYVQRRHPNPTLPRPLIDYDASLLFAPPLLAGTLIGTTLSVVFPDWLVTILLVLLLAYTSDATLRKGIATWNKQEQTVRGHLYDAHEVRDGSSTLSAAPAPRSPSSRQQQGEAGPVNPLGEGGAVSAEPRASSGLRASASLRVSLLADDSGILARKSGRGSGLRASLSIALSARTSQLSDYFSEEDGPGPFLEEDFGSEAGGPLDDHELNPRLRQMSANLVHNASFFFSFMFS